MSQMMVPLNQSVFFSAFLSAAVEGVFCGIFLVMALVTIYLLAFRQEPVYRRTNRLRRQFLKASVLGTVALLLLVPAHWIVTMARATIILSDSSLTKRSDRILPISLVGMALALVTTVVTDAILMWRLWIVSSRSWLALVPPAISWIIFGALSTVAAVLFFWEVKERAPERRISTNMTTICAAGSAMFTNFYCAAAIAYYLSRILRNSFSVDTSKWKFLLVIVVESAAIWSAWCLFIFFSFQFRSPLFEVALHAFPAIAGIACILINVRVGLGRDIVPISERLCSFVDDSLHFIKRSSTFSFDNDADFNEEGDTYRRNRSHSAPQIMLDIPTSDLDIRKVI
ncbi:hypothetical protein FA15DRAFT_701894 [Coprinopsis marcescibilis]|uniref:G-protein coupled receptors family 1 profile domain-containing protein n=1 Tax=Coprinopsis marcescibilis TaxID=230819 RepID=A0A5C3L5S8_COPMA|nr:hypothetical protein FA15DRAFT_701894 [Coprinopsis marcescibilis]